MQRFVKEPEIEEPLPERGMSSEPETEEPEQGMSSEPETEEPEEELQDIDEDDPEAGPGARRQMRRKRTPVQRRLDFGRPARTNLKF
jgi:hypothetical protein